MKKLTRILFCFVLLLALSLAAAAVASAEDYNVWVNGLLESTSYTSL